MTSNFEHVTNARIWRHANASYIVGERHSVIKSNTQVTSRTSQLNKWITQFQRLMPFKLNKTVPVQCSVVEVQSSMGKGGVYWPPFCISLKHWTPAEETSGRTNCQMNCKLWYHQRITGTGTEGLGVDAAAQLQSQSSSTERCQATFRTVARNSAQRHLTFSENRKLHCKYTLIIIIVNFSPNGNCCSVWWAEW